MTTTDNLYSTCVFFEPALRDQQAQARFGRDRTSLNLAETQELGPRRAQILALTYTAHASSETNFFVRALFPAPKRKARRS